jgi:hypothetical protein
LLDTIAPFHKLLILSGLPTSNITYVTNDALPYTTLRPIRRNQGPVAVASTALALVDPSNEHAYKLTIFFVNSKGAGLHYISFSDLFCII